MSQPSLQERFDAVGLHPPETDYVALGEHVAEVDRMVAWLRSADLTYANEPAVCFAAPKP